MSVYWSVEECRWVEYPSVALRDAEVQVPEQREAEERELATQS